MASLELNLDAVSRHGGLGPWTPGYASDLDTTLNESKPDKAAPRDQIRATQDEWRGAKSFTALTVLCAFCATLRANASPT